MFYGAPARSLDDIARLRRNGFDFGEIAIANAGARRMWWESGVVNGVGLETRTLRILLESTLGGTLAVGLMGKRQTGLDQQ